MHKMQFLIPQHIYLYNSSWWTVEARCETVRACVCDYPYMKSDVKTISFSNACIITNEVSDSAHICGLFRYVTIL